jgi:uncharacterized membrane protein (DUF4010 family)
MCPIPLDTGDPGTTSVVALLVCYTLGAMVWFGHGSTAVMLAVATTVLLYFKAELHGISKSLTPLDLLSILQFGILALVILPILPDRNFGPYDALNPRNIWLMVVLISGVSLAGYAALRMVGARHGAALIGLFGGTGVVHRDDHDLRPPRPRPCRSLARTAMVVILLANIVVLVRLSVVTFIVAPAILPPLVSVLGAGLVLGVAPPCGAGASSKAVTSCPCPRSATRPKSRTALGFGLLYALVLVLSAWLQDIAGSRGLYLLALASGLTDVDAITLSSLRMFGMEKLDAAQTVTAITLATLSNLAFKTGLVLVIGGRGAGALHPAGLPCHCRRAGRRPVPDGLTMITATTQRPPAVAGMFYPGDPAALRDELATCLVVPPYCQRRLLLAGSKP